MTRSVADWMYRYRWWPWVITVLILPWQLWPASEWFEVRSLHVSDSRFGEPIPITLERSIHKPFDATWTVNIRRWDGGWVSDCIASGAQAYKPDAVLPKSPTLHWWTWGKCHPLQPGKYEVHTVWQVSPGWPFPAKRVEVTSDVFEVRE